MNLNYTYKLKCPDSDHGETDIWDVLSEKPSRTYYCHGHKITHTDLYTVWFTGHQENIKKHLSHHKAIFETAIHVFEIENTAFVV
jgi:hypothetical protein